MKFFQNSQPEWERSTDLMNPNHALYQLSYRLKLVGTEGLEPSRLAALDFETSVSTQFHHVPIKIKPNCQYADLLHEPIL